MGVYLIHLWAADGPKPGLALSSRPSRGVESEPEAREVSARIVAARGGGLRGELASGGRCWIRRHDLQGRQRARDPSSFVGDVLRGLVVGPSRRGEGPLVSPRHLARARFQSALDRRRTVSGEVVDANRGGLIVDVCGLEAFVPRRELTRRQNSDHRSLVATRWRGWVLAVSSHEVILTSHGPRRQARRARQRRRYLERLAAGDLRRGRVLAPVRGGAIVRLHRAGVDALVLSAKPSEPAVGSCWAPGDSRIRVRITAIRPGGPRGEPRIRAREA